MSNTIQFVICGLVLIAVAIDGAEPPSNLPEDYVQCKKNDPKFNECLKDGLNRAMSYLANGIPNLGLIQLDPLRIADLKIDQSMTRPGTIILKFKDIDIYNLKYTVIKNLRYDPVSRYATIDMLFPNPLIIQGNYEINGKVLVVPITGKGKCKLAIEISKVDLNIQFEPTVRNEYTYLKIEDLTLHFFPMSLQVQFDDLFHGDKILGDKMNVFLNENWRNVLFELQPTLENVLGEVIKDKSQKFFDRIPENDLYLT